MGNCKSRNTVSIIQKSRAIGETSQVTTDNLKCQNKSEVSKSQDINTNRDLNADRSPMDQKNTPEIPVEDRVVRIENNLLPSRQEVSSPNDGLQMIRDRIRPSISIPAQTICYVARSQAGIEYRVPQLDSVDTSSLAKRRASVIQASSGQHLPHISPKGSRQRNFSTESLLRPQQAR